MGNVAHGDNLGKHGGPCHGVSVQHQRMVGYAVDGLQGRTEWVAVYPGLALTLYRDEHTFAGGEGGIACRNINNVIAVHHASVIDLEGLAADEGGLCSQFRTRGREFAAIATV